MSYDIYLKERVSGETIMLPNKHLMTGGTYRADYDEKTGTFSPSAINEAWLNITYNYSRYYYEAAEGDKRFYGEKEWPKEEGVHNLGIRGLYGKTGLESLSMLKDLISRIESNYKKNGDWITTKRSKIVYKDDFGKELEFVEILGKKIKYTEEKIDVEVYEGPSSDYWASTAANAIKPLYQLLVFAELRPDGIWYGD